MLHYEFIGNKNADNLIVFLHEGLGCIEMWRGFPLTLVTELNCCGLVYDRKGYGKSSGSLKGRKVTYLHEAAEELFSFLNSLELKFKRIHLYGHSDGGSIALIYASKYQNTIASVITEAAHAFVEEITVAGVKAAMAPFKEGKLDGLKKYHGDRYDEVFWAWNDIWQTEAFKTWNILNEIQEITLPSLIIQGLDDQYGSPMQVEEICSYIGSSAIPFLIKDAGHSPHIGHPKEIISKIKTVMPDLHD